MNKANFLFYRAVTIIFFYLHIHVLDQFFAFDAVPKTITVTPKSKAGSKISTINFFINKNQANNTMIFHFFSSPYFTIHNNSGEKIRHDHDIHPTFSILVRNTNDTFMSYRYLSAFQNLSSAQCVYNSTTYLTIPLDIILSSDSLYHLGDQVVYLGADDNIQNFQRFYFIAKISIRVQAGMDMFLGICMYSCRLNFCQIRM